MLHADRRGWAEFVMPVSCLVWQKYSTLRYRIKLREMCGSRHRPVTRPSNLPHGFMAIEESENGT